MMSGAVAKLRHVDGSVCTNRSGDIAIRLRSLRGAAISMGGKVVRALARHAVGISEFGHAHAR